MKPVYALLDKNVISMFKDSHLTDMLFSFKASLVEFIDLGVSNFNEDTGEKFFFLKMVYKAISQPTGRDVFLIAIHSDHVKKWEHCLNL